MRRLDERNVCIGVFILSVLLNLGFSSVGLRNSLLEIHEFRQLQTAYSTRYIQSDGFSLAYPTPLFGPPWSAPMEFPLYQVCVAQFVKLTGLPLEPAGRLVSLAFLFLGLPAGFGLAGLLALPPHRRWLFLSLILLSPGYLYYSRSFLIESTALCVSAWFLLGYCKALQLRSRGWLAAAVGFGIAAALTKVTTLIVFLVVAAAYTLHLLWKDARDPTTRPRLWGTILFALAATIPAVAIGTAWVHFSDAVKLSNPLSADLVSANLWTFNFGTWHQRLSGQF
ncbi:MAG TPA: hypothetical protein VL069_01875, partial [Opitutus sp.]|nr:hypothetical protein [Opitutus sp.]